VGTALDVYGLTTAGGRVLGITGSGPDLDTAIRNTYS
jgi:phosphoribosylamine-glycine ligase